MTQSNRIFEFSLRNQLIYLFHAYFITHSFILNPFNSYTNPILTSKHSQAPVSYKYIGFDFVKGKYRTCFQVSKHHQFAVPYAVLSQVPGYICTAEDTTGACKLKVCATHDNIVGPVVEASTRKDDLHKALKGRCQC